jgi:phage baseplate assembly protein W
MDKTSLGFPFRLNEVGQVATLSGNDNLQAKILQVVLTSPGERVNLPDFGCGLRDLVFDPNNDVLAATTEFAINKALQQWLGQDIVVRSVDVSNDDAELQIAITYVQGDRLEPAQIKITF